MDMDSLSSLKRTPVQTFLNDLEVYTLIMITFYLGLYYINILIIVILRRIALMIFLSTLKSIFLLPYKLPLDGGYSITKSTNHWCSGIYMD